MFEGGVQMRFFAKLNHFAEVLVIDVRVDSEKPLQYCLCDREKVLRKGYT